MTNYIVSVIMYYLMSPTSDWREEQLGGGLVPVEPPLHHHHLQRRSELEIISHLISYFSPGRPWLDTVRVTAGHHPDVLPVWARVSADINLDIQVAVLHLPPHQGHVHLPGFSFLNKGLLSVFSQFIMPRSEKL